MKKAYYVLELIVLFVGIPVLFYIEPEFLKNKKILTLVIFTLLCLSILLFDKNFDRRLFWNSEGTKSYVIKILLRSALVFIALTIFVLLTNPDNLFIFPLSRPWIWLLVMALYPLLSAYPQELIYRTFFFHRYEKIFGRGISMIIASGMIFSFLHIMYDNVPALILSFLGGLAFSKTYKDTESLWVVSLEHAIYGNLIFTVGLNGYFYEGM